MAPSGGSNRRRVDRRAIAVALLVAAVVLSGRLGAGEEAGTLAPAAGSILCVRSQWRTPSGHIEAMSPDGSRHVALWETGTFTWLAVSPDGRRVAFGLDSGIYLAQPKQALRNLSEAWGLPSGYHPAWTPDGAALLFLHQPAPEDVAEVWTIGADGTHLRCLVRDRPAIRSVGTALDCFDLQGRLLLASDVPEPGRPEGEHTVAVDLGTGKWTPLDLPQAEVEALWALRPVRSPDGSKLAFQRGGGLWVRDGEGQETALTGTQLGAVEPLFWTPEADGIVCRAPNGRVWEVPLRAGGESRLLSTRARPEVETRDERIGTVWTALPPEDWLPPLAAGRPATVTVTSDPSGADVFINGVYKGRAPLKASIASAGNIGRRYTVSLARDHRAIVARHLFACRGQSQALRVALSEPLTAPNLPPELARVRNEVREAIIHRSPELLLKFAAPEGIWGPARVDWDPGLSHPREVVRGERFPSTEGMKYLFETFRDRLLLEPERVGSDLHGARPLPPAKSGMGWWFSDYAEPVHWLAIEQRAGRWCVTTFGQAQIAY